MTLEMAEIDQPGPSTPIGRMPEYKLSHSFLGHGRAVTALTFSPDGQTLISAGMSFFQPG